MLEALDANVFSARKLHISAWGEKLGSEYAVPILYKVMVQKTGQKEREECCLP